MSSDTVPGARPFMLLILAVVRIPLDHPVLPLLRQIAEWHIDGDLAELTEFHHVVLALCALAGQPWFDYALGEGFLSVGQRKIVIDGDDPAKPAARGTGAGGVIETEQGRGGFAVFDVALRAVEAVGEEPRLPDGRLCAGTF